MHLKKTEKEIKEKRLPKKFYIDASNFGIKIHTPESRPFPQQVRYEYLVEGLRYKRFKLTYTAKKPEK